MSLAERLGIAMTAGGFIAIIGGAALVLLILAPEEGWLFRLTNADEGLIDLLDAQDINVTLRTAIARH